MRLKNIERIRAMSLLSGGLDSLLTICVLKTQGIDVHGIVFESPFFDSTAARAGAEHLGVPLHALNFASEIISVLNNPRHGYGSCMNPCIDCHALMLKRAGELMEEMNFHFLSTGEVLNERPMSQNRQSLEIVARESGYEGLIVRPLSAGLLPETKPEQMGWIDRSCLLSIEGRSRKSQIQLAYRYGLINVPSPSGGCRLTDPNFCKRLKDLKEHEGLVGVRAIYLLRFGRHFRLDDKVKIIIGRNEKDNAILEGNAELYDFILKVENVAGPTGLLPFTAREDQIRMGATICVRYSDCFSNKPVTVKIRSSRGVRRIKVMSATEEETKRLRI